MRIFSLTTKTPFHRRPKGSHRVRTALIWGACALIVLVFLYRPLGTLISYIGTPVHVVATWFTESTWSVPSYIRAQHALITERDALRSELDARANDALRIDQLEYDNAALRALLSAEERSRIAAGIIARPDQTPYDTILLDRGSNDGIREGALVFAYDDVAIGSVIRTFPDSALVSLYSTPGVRSIVYLVGPDMFAIAEGQGGGVVKVGVPQGVPLTVGDAAILPTVASGVFGRIAYVESDESNPEQYGFITISADISSLRFVAVDAKTHEEFSYDDARAIVDRAVSLMATSSLSVFASSTDAIYGTSSPQE